MSIIYQQYDSQTLFPLNNETEIRRLELESFMYEVKNRTVLDIGCSNGFASILAAKSGARSIIAIDVDQDALTNLNGVINSHSFQITTENIGFGDLNTPTFQAEVVFCFEVIHWLNHQGVSTNEILRRLDELASDLIFIETPWSVNDVSVSKYKGTSMDSYSLKEIIEGLNKLNFKVEFLYFVNYFSAPNERVMLRAAKI